MKILAKKTLIKNSNYYWEPKSKYKSHKRIHANIIIYQPPQALNIYKIKYKR